MEVTRYAVAGVINTFVGYAVFWMAYRWMGLSPAAANTLGYTVALGVSFLLSSYFVFSNSKPIVSVAGRFVVAFTIAFLLNQFVLFILLSTAFLSAEIAQIFAMIAYTVVFYLLSKYFVFAVCKKANLPLGTIRDE